MSCCCKNCDMTDANCGWTRCHCSSSKLVNHKSCKGKLSRSAVPSSQLDDVYQTGDIDVMPLQRL